jgi:hypothetical protein
MIATIRAALGRPLRLFPIGSAAKVACHVPVAGPLARRLYGSLELSDARFRSTFAWSPEITSEVGLAEMARTSRRATHAAG